VSPRKPPERWFRLADADLRAAELLLRTSESPPLYHLVCFHCQQAAEKALKGLLVSKDLKTPRTHDLEGLVRRIATTQPAIVEVLETATRLSDFAVAPRYADEIGEPGEAEARQCLDDARAVLACVRRLRPPSPQKELPMS